MQALWDRGLQTRSALPPLRRTLLSGSTSQTAQLLTTTRKNISVAVDPLHACWCLNMATLVLSNRETRLTLGNNVNII